MESRSLASSSKHTYARCDGDRQQANTERGVIANDENPISDKQLMVDSGGGTRTPDTRIMISDRRSDQSGPIGNNSHNDNDITANEGDAIPDESR